MIPLTISSENEEASENSQGVSTSLSGDLREYAAVQEIPKFGIHGYYATSSESMSNWVHKPSHSSNDEELIVDSDTICPIAPACEEAPEEVKESPSDDINDLLYFELAKSLNIIVFTVSFEFLQLYIEMGGFLKI